MIALQEPVKLCPVATGESGRRGYLALGNFQQLYQVITFEALLGIRIGEFIQFIRRSFVQRAGYQIRGNERRYAECTALFHHIYELTHISRPIEDSEHFHGVGREVVQGTSMFLAQDLEEMTREQGDILTTLP
jgi:hypothetical protein